MLSQQDCLSIEGIDHPRMCLFSYSRLIFLLLEPWYMNLIVEILKM